MTGDGVSKAGGSKAGVTGAEVIAGAAELTEVVKGGFCIGCGACGVVAPEIEIKSTPYGQLEAALPVDEPWALYKGAGVCPFAAPRNEDDLGKVRFAAAGTEDTHDKGGYDPQVGFYSEILAGHVARGSFRARGSSGGVTSWVLVQMMEAGLIDGVIHVGETGQQGALFEYRLSHSVAEVISGGKSRYYPVQMADVLRQVRESDKRYALVGVPCFIKAARLLAEQDDVLAQRLVFFLAIFCGHLKSKAFAEMIAWQRQLPPEQLRFMDFRVKTPDQPANRYRVAFGARAKERGATSVAVRNLFGMDWGLGYFKPKACDWCDDIAGETADLACGDAWLPEFVNQPEGSNILVVRHPVVLKLLEAGMASGALALRPMTVADVVTSQGGNYRHRREGLSVRVARARRSGRWYPKKREALLTGFQVSDRQAQLYRLREQLAAQSHEVFSEAKQRGRLGYFFWRMLPLELRYRYYQGSLLRSLVKAAYNYGGFLFSRFLFKRGGD